ncbi:hypothetical protein VCR17J2_410015 [Vibrio coralliirubri]|nr:hypothetical protein VCR17J2_410015 [Vibrio coralliirubri]
MFLGSLITPASVEVWFIYPALLDPVELHAEMVRAAKIARKIFI